MWRKGDTGVERAAAAEGAAWVRWRMVARKKQKRKRQRRRGDRRGQGGKKNGMKSRKKRLQASRRIQTHLMAPRRPHKD